MNSFDEASFLMQSSGLEGGTCVCLCVCVDPVASWHGVISAALLILPKSCLCVCVAAHIASLCPFELTWWTLLNAAVDGLS